MSFHFCISEKVYFTFVFAIYFCSRLADFSFSASKMFLHHLLVCTVSNNVFATILIFVPLHIIHFFLLTAFNVFSLSLLSATWLWGALVWFSLWFLCLKLSFCDLWVYIFHQFIFFSHYFFTYLLTSPSPCPLFLGFQLHVCKAA